MNSAITTGAIIEADGLTREFRVRDGKRRRLLTAVDGLTVAIEPGEAVGYIDANGAGKSTTIKMLTGILVPTAGRVLTCGLRPVPDRRRLARQVGVVFGQRSQPVHRVHGRRSHRPCRPGVSRRHRARAARRAAGDRHRPDAVHLSPHWRDIVTQHIGELGEAWDDPLAWQGSANVPGLDLSNEMWGKITLTELIVHGWDIAKATGQSFDLPERTLQACLDHVAKFVPNAPVPALWGPPVDIAPDAALLDRIVAITGRAP
jgi:uncharacterized protein (TIGR03086 family)